MPSIKYKCNNCEKTFIGDDFTSECPNCHDSNIVHLGGAGGGIFEKIIQFFKDNKNAKYVLSGIVILFIILNLKDCTDKSKGEYKIILNPVPGYIEFYVIKVVENENTNKTKIDTLNFSMVEKIFNFRDRNDNLIPFDDNRYYVCDSGDYTIFWNNNSSYKLTNPRDTSKTVTVSLLNGKRDSKAVCFESLETISVTPLGNCSISIQTNLDKKPGIVVLISINGRGGPYFPDRRRDMHKIDKYYIWAHVEGRDTVKFPPLEYIGNGNPYLDNACKPFDPTSLIKAITDAGNAYGKAPTNKTLRNRFANLIDGSTKIYLDNKLLTDISDLLNACQAQNENSNRTFSVTVQVDTNNKKVSVYFK